MIKEIKLQPIWDYYATMHTMQTILCNKTDDYKFCIIKIINDQSFKSIFLPLGVYPTEKLLQMSRQYKKKIMFLAAFYSIKH